MKERRHGILVSCKDYYCGGNQGQSRQTVWKMDKEWFLRANAKMDKQPVSPKCRMYLVGGCHKQAQ